MLELSKRIKDLPTISSLQNSTQFPVGDGTTNTGYKSTLNDLKSYIGTTPLGSPLIIDEASAPTTAAGTITWTIASNIATLSSTTDHGNLSVNDVILISGNVETYIVSIGTFPYVTILDTYTDRTAVGFSYVQPSYIARNSSGTTNTVISQGGVMTSGSIVSNNPSSFRGTVKVYGDVVADNTVNTDKLRSTDGVNTTRWQYDDGMYTNPYRPGFNAGMSSDFTSVTAASWQKVPFNLVNSTDSASCTFTRVPVGAAGYDTTNYLFKVPYVASEYSETLYTLTASLYIEINSSGPPDYVIVSIVGVTNTSWGTPLELAREIHTSIGTHPPIYQSVDVTRVVKLNPNTVASHRYIGVRVYHTFTGLSVRNISVNASNFSGICHG